MKGFANEYNNYDANQDYSKYAKETAGLITTIKDLFKKNDDNSTSEQPNTPAPPATTEPKKSNIGLYIGIGVGVLALTTIGIIIYKTRK